MRKASILAVMGLFLAAALWATPAQEPAAPSAKADSQVTKQAVSEDPAARIEITASRYQFSPDTIRVKAGTAVELYVTSTDGVHGLSIPGLKINQTLQQGKTVKIDFTPTKPGSYPFLCSVFCGPGHGEMKGELIVEK